MAKKKLNYALSADAAKKPMPAPKLPYQPRDPKKYHPNIALIACGGITEMHLTAYKKAGYNIVALCDLIEERAENRRKQFFPDAKIYTDYRQILKRDDIEVVDIATHPKERLPIITDALKARKHVLSQKPFVIDLDAGRRLVNLARKQKVNFAVNQNGRWAPYFSYMRHAIEAGLIGQVIGAHLSVHWDHSWTKGTPFEKIRHLILYDFAIHWFDALTTLMGGQRAKRVYASVASTPNQPIKPWLLGEALVEYEGAQATLAFDGHVKWGQTYRNYVAGTKGTLSSGGDRLGTQDVTLYTPKGIATAKIEGNWFPDGFHGTMAELLRSIEEKREPTNSAARNLASLELCFAAIASAEDHEPKVPGKVRKLFGY